MSLDPAKLQEPLRRLRKLLKKFPERPSPEQVHNLRTRSRRIEAMLKALMLTSRRNEKGLLQELAPVRKKAGKVRDMDVLTGFSSGLHDDEKQCLIELLEYLGAERYRQCRKLRSLIQRQKAPIRRRLTRLSRFIDKGLRAARQSDSGSDWPIDAMAVALKVSNQLSRWPALSPANLHPYRLKVKELLYVLQLADEADEDLVNNLGHVKDAIGECHDWQELGTIAGKLLHHGSQCGVLKQIQGKMRDTFDHALLTANNLRKQYLEGTASNLQGGNHKKAVTRLNRPVVLAITSFAA
jgi:CHAD domain-containing protein